jgi:hypothetical protein
VEPPEDAVRVLRHVHRLARPHGVVLDLTSIPPAAVVEHHGDVVGSLDQAVFLERAALTEAAVDAVISEGLLVEEASLAHDVLKYFESGRELVADVAGRRVTRLSPGLKGVLEGIDGPLVERSFCLLRRLRALSG